MSIFGLAVKPPNCGECGRDILNLVRQPEASSSNECQAFSRRMRAREHFVNDPDKGQPVPALRNCTREGSMTSHLVLLTSILMKEQTNREFHDMIAKDGYGGLRGTLGRMRLRGSSPKSPRVKLLFSGDGFFGQHPFKLLPEAKGCFYEDGYKHIAKETVEVGFSDRALEQYWRAYRKLIFHTGACLGVERIWPGDRLVRRWESGFGFPFEI